MALLDDALALTAYGFRVHPIRGKIPLAEAWPTIATADAQAAQSLFAAHPDATGIGIATGAFGGLSADAAPAGVPDHVLVLDVDPANGGEESLAALCGQYGQIPPTVCALTGSGGMHYYYLAPAGFRNSAGKLGPGLDTRAEGGYVAAPPSRHPSGTYYRWAPSYGPGEVALADAPAWMLSLLKPASVPRAQPAPRPEVDRSDVIRRASRYLGALPPAVSGQGGHGALFAATLALVRGFCLTPSDALDLLTVEYNPRCQPLWSEKELCHKIDSVVSSSAGPPAGYLLDAPRPESARRLRAVPTPSQEPPPHGDTDVPPEFAAAAPPVEPPPRVGGGPPGPPPGPPIPIGSRPLSKSYASLCQILRTPGLRRQVLGDGRLEFNTLTLEPTLARRPLTDTDLSRIRELSEVCFATRQGPDKPSKGLQFSTADVSAAILQVANEAPFHPVAEYLRSFGWDGVPRLDRVAQDILSVDLAAQPLASVLVRKWMISAAARALRPGCKVDTVLVLTGSQGAFKSSFFRTLASAAWFSDAAFDLHNKDSLLLLRRVWILEWAELEAMTRARTSEAVKAFLTAQIDYLRPPYGRTVQEYPRSCVIGGSANKPEFLSDDTGGRRFWPVRVGGRIDLETLARDRDQLWAEAVAALDAGEPWWLDKAASTQLATTQAADHEVLDAWTETVLGWLEGRTTPQTTADILVGAVARPLGQVVKADADRVGAILRRAGWVQRTQRIIVGRTTRCWVKKAPSEATE